MEIIDTFNIRVWELALLPFTEPEKANDELVCEFQKECIEKGVVGMGWRPNNFQPANDSFDYIEDGIDAASNIQRYLNSWQENRRKTDGNSNYSYENDTSLLNCLKYFNQIMIGDYVIFRARKGKCYVGKIAEKPHYLNDNERLSWGFTVERKEDGKFWEIYTLENTPAEITGRFSAVNHSTFSPIRNVRQRLMIKKMYEQKHFDLPTIRLSPYNFDRSFDYTELEDLVYLYITDEIKANYNDKGYVYLPSTGKKSRPLYEFSFCSSSSKPISCQVKNQEDVNPKLYYEDSDEYTKIYLYSGLWKNPPKSTKDNVVCISRKQLFSKVKIYLELSNKSKWYDVSKDENDSCFDAIKADVKYYEKSGKMHWRRADNFIGWVEYDDCFCFGSDRVYYSKEFGCIINDLDGITGTVLASELSACLSK